MTVNGLHVRLPAPSGQADLAPAKVYDLAKLSDDRSRTLDRLLRDGHFAKAPLRDPELILHSHLPHVSVNARPPLQQLLMPI